MIKVTNIKIGIDEYVVLPNAEMGGTHLGSINPYACEIKLRTTTYDNRPINKRMYFKVLMHEIVHGIDFNTFFVGESVKEDIEPSEDVIDLTTVFILKHLRDIIEKREEFFEVFAEYAELCEYKIERLPLAYYAILDFIDDNPALIEEFLEVYSV